MNQITLIVVVLRPRIIIKIKNKGNSDKGKSFSYFLCIGCPLVSYIYKIGGMAMVRKELKGSMITILLVIILGGIIISTLKSTYLYYCGPEYKVDCYIQYLNQREYDKIYQILSTDSVKNFKGKESIEAYYKKIYEQENKLVSVDKIGRSYTTFKLKYQFANNTVKEQLEVVKEKGGWHIKFPFETSNIAVFAPLGSKIYLNSMQLTYNGATRQYEGENILPGTYLLKVIFDQGRYKDYYKVIHIPEQLSFDVPYDTAYVTIQCAPNLKVSLDQFSKVNSGNKVTFNDILLDEYKIKIEDEKGNFKTQEYAVKISKDNHNFKFKEFALTPKGEERLEKFFETFYNEYIDAISSRETKKLATYFSGAEKQTQLSEFKDWYINQKEIEQVKMNLKIGESQIDENGQIHTLIRETSELYNREYDEQLGQEAIRCYQVILDIDTTINVLEKDWKIVDRQIVQSLVAVKDQEGKWVQY